MYENSSFWESIMPAEEDRGKGDKQNETATRMEASALPSLPDGNLIQQQPRELRERDAKDVCCTRHTVYQVLVQEPRKRGGDPCLCHGENC